MTDSVKPNNKLSMTRDRLMISAVVAEAGMLVVAVILGWFFDIPFWNTISTDIRAISLGILLALPLVAMAIVCAEVPLRMFDRMRKDFDMVIGLFENCSIFDILVVSVLAGVGEEALFRGFFQPLLTDYVGPYAAIAIVGTVFGLIHALSISYAIFATIIGVFLGILYWRFDNLLIPVLVHAVYDFLALVYGVRIRSKNNS